MANEFNSLTRRNGVRKLLQNLRLSRILETKRIPVSEALEEVGETRIHWLTFVTGDIHPNLRHYSHEVLYQDRLY